MFGKDAVQVMRGMGRLSLCFLSSHKPLSPRPSSHHRIGAGVPVWSPLRSTDGRFLAAWLGRGVDGVLGIDAAAAGEGFASSESSATWSQSSSPTNRDKRSQGRGTKCDVSIINRQIFEKLISRRRAKVT